MMYIKLNLNYKRLLFLQQVIWINERISISSYKLFVLLKRVIIGIVFFFFFDIDFSVYGRVLRRYSKWKR